MDAKPLLAMKRVAIYTRVSTSEQTTDPQLIELREYCARRGWTEVREFTDKISGAKFSRLGLDMLMGAVRRGKIDVVVCVKLDRLGRSLRHMAQLVAELETNQVALISTTQGIDTSEGNAAGRLQMNVLLAVAEFEKDLIRERTKAGMVAAKARGSRIGRPRFEMTPERQKILAEGAGLSVGQLAKRLGCSVGKAHALAKAKP